MPRFMLCSTFSQFPIWVWFVLFMFLVFLLLSLCFGFQLRKSNCLNQSCSSASRNDDEYREGVVDSEASSSIDEYDVFLSFRGPDTRQGITDVLYDTMKRAGICVFRDDDEVSIGQPFWKILHAIETSQICMPIFSRTFAESSWCLREVAKMIELKKLVMPIFFDVNPDDVKLKTGAYRKHLKMHEKKNGKEQVKLWEDALREVARIKGKQVLNTGYTEFCKKLVEESLSKLRPRKTSYDECLVGIDKQIKSVMKLVDIESPDVRYVGIHGMGGIGKTTLAKALYEKLSANFDSSCFMADVRESSLRCNGLQDLRNQLQAGLDPEFTRGCNSLRGIEERFWSKKVLIVLDDVDKLEQLEKLVGQSNWFGSGSRIVVTTRNVDVLKKYGKSVRFFEMTTLEPVQALELFQRYAFREEKPPPILEAISREIVSTAGGLPLALKVMGSRLYNVKDGRVWREMLERSREVQDRDVKERLRISYDALEYDQKKMFLDIACVPDLKNKVKAMYMWEASKLYPHMNLAVLSSMSLVKFDDDNIWMHDLLRDLGKDIDQDESTKLVSGKRSRVYEIDEALNVLLGRKGKDNVEVLCVKKSLKMSLTNEHFARFNKLRFLKLVGTDIEGDFKNLLPNLVWFTWCYCPQILKATNLCMKNLVVLTLSHGYINESWNGWGIVQKLHNLKDLDLSYCQNLTRTPDFSETSSLERLTFFGCCQLHEIHGSIGKLKRLKYLDLRCCDSLGGFPNEIGRLVNLEEIRVSRSYRKRKPLIKFNLPMTIGYLKSLVVLELENLEIADIPDSIGGLVKLKHMNLHTSAEVLPESLGDLKSLVSLDICASRMSKLPDSVGRLVKLESLRLLKCSNLEELPQSLGKLKKLEQVVFTSISGMLEQVPIELFGCSCLRSLKLNGSSISSLPSAITQLPFLERLGLEENHQLQELPDLPLSLRYLSVSSKSLQRIPDLSRLVNLIKLKLFNMDDYRWPHRLPSSKVEGIEKLTMLKKLELGAASATTFDLGSLTRLKYLSLDFRPDIDCDSLEDNSQAGIKMGLKLPDLSGLKNLSELSLQNFWMEDGGIGIQHLGNVKRVYLKNCGVKLREQICVMMKKLQYLSVHDCGSVGTFPTVSELENLGSLEIYNCKDVVKIPADVGNLESLNYLLIRDCVSLKRVDNASKLEKLSNMVLFNCPKLRTVEGIDRLLLSKWKN